MSNDVIAVHELCKVFGKTVVDGVRVDTPDGWVHVRPSNTEPVVRVIGEAPREEVLTQLFTGAREM